MNLKTKYIAGVFSCILLGVLAIFGHETLSIPIAHANTSTSTNLLSDMFTLVSLIASFLHRMTLVLLQQMELLLDPRFVIDLFAHLQQPNGANGVNPLQELWTISRDLVNIILAVILVAGAIMTIITHSNDYIAPYARKFVIAIILVNFSWFFPRVILDVANVLTATVYSIPAAVDSTCVYYEAGNTNAQPCHYPQSMVFDVEKSDLNIFTSNGFECSFLNDCWTIEPISTNATTPITANNPSAILGTLAFSHLRLADIPKVKASLANLSAQNNISKNQFKSVLRDVMHVGFSLLLIIAIFFPLLAMFVAFLIRIPILWFTISFMPFMFIGLVVGDKMGSFNPMERIFKKFITAAFLPFVVAIPLAAGFILLNAGSHLWNAPPLSAAVLGAGDSFLVVGVQTAWQLLWMFMTFTVFWSGTFAALKIDDAYEGVANTIQSYGKSMGTVMAKAPLAVPFIPAVGNLPGGQSILGVKKAFSPAALNQSIDKKVSDQMNAGGLGGGGGGGGGGNSAHQVAQSIKNTGNHRSTFRNQVDKMIVNNMHRTEYGSMTHAQQTATDSAMTEIRKLVVQEHGGTMSYENVKKIAQQIGMTMPTDANEEAQFKRNVERWMRAHP